MDTIFAQATAPGKSGVAIIRISGTHAFAIGARLAGRSLPARGMTLATLRDSADGQLDGALVLSFAGPASFTGEDCVEFQCHGSPAVIGALTTELLQTDQCRLAEPGEFTRRAMENGKLDLAQVEGLADLIAAETEAQRKQAQRVLSGQMKDSVEAWRADLIRAASLIEATIDFADEDVPVDVTGDVAEMLEKTRKSLQTECDKVERAERVRSGFEVAIIGEPNVGKSTLLNALAGREAAITSRIAGTTRDVVEVRMDLKGVPVTFLDTAGLRDTDDEIELIGVRLAKARAESADIRLFLSVDPDRLGVARQGGDVTVLPKGDLRSEIEGSVSGLTGAGVDRVIAAIHLELADRVPGAAIATRFRHGEAMARAISYLRAAEDQLSLGPDRYDIVAEDIRSGIRSLERLVGRIDVEDVLDEIFASFCVGK